MRDLGDRIGTVVGKAQTFNSEVDIINKQRELVTENISRDGGATYHDLQKVNQKALDFAVDTSVTAFIETPMLVDEVLSNVDIAFSVSGLVMDVAKSATKTAPKAYANVLKNAEEGQLKSLASKRRDPGMVYHNDPQKGTADANRAANRAKGIPDRDLGPSGKPKIHSPRLPTRKVAQDAAQATSGKGGTVVEHVNPKVGNSHFHAVKPNGVKVRTHFGFPD